MSPFRKPLDLNLYEQYYIDQRYQAYVVSMESLDENQCDDIEAQYIQQGYKVFHVDTQRDKEGMFKLKLIIAKLDMTF